MGHVCLQILIASCGLLQGLTADDIRRAEAELMNGLRGQEQFQGEFRTPSPWTTAPNGRGSTFVPPLPLPDPPRPIQTPGVVSAARLVHKVPKKAKQAYDRATKLTKAEKYQESSAQLELAIQLDPGFPEAHNNLGVQYFLLTRYDDAEREFQRAAELDPALGAPHTNLSTLAYIRGDFAQAEREARRALALTPGSEQARDILNAAIAARARQ